MLRTGSRQGYASKRQFYEFCRTETLSDAVTALLCDANRRVSLGAAARARVLAQFDIRRMVSRYESLYSRYVDRELIGATSRPFEEA